MGWTDVVGIVGVVLAILIVLPLVGLYLRRRWIAREGGMFECSVREANAAEGSGWMLGVARYSGDYLEWFRAFSWQLHPSVRILRGGTALVRHRDPDPVEAVTLYDDQVIVELASRGSRWELAMAPSCLTGLQSWLESAPPGEGWYGRSESPD